MDPKKKDITIIYISVHVDNLLLSGFNSYQYLKLLKKFIT